MTSGRYGLALRAVGRLLGGGSVAALGTARLLERFAASRDEAAFEALVARHGPMVLGTCRRMLADPHDVDDAFQATFLVLARKAGSIQDADRLGPWLHGVARRVATRSRALAARRDARERHGLGDPAVEAPDLLEGLELRAAVDEELSLLPEKYRAPLVLCYLEGLTHDEAAEHLRWPVGTVRSRLAGGRDRLRARLTRRGLAPTAAVPAVLTRLSIPQTLLTTTVRVATTAGSAPAHVANLAKGALIAMMWNKLKLIAALGLMAGLTVGGAGIAAQRGEAGKVEPRGEELPTSPEQAEKEWERVKAEALAVQKKAKDLQAQHDQLQAQHDQEMRSLRESYQDLHSRLDELSTRWGKLKTDAAPAAIDDRIKRLETELRVSRAETLDFQRKLDVLATANARPSPGPGASKAEEAPVSVVGGTAGANPPAPRPTVYDMRTNGTRAGPPLFAVVSAEKDRVTMIDSATKEKATFRMPRGATEIHPVMSNVISLLITGPEVTRAAFYDLQDKRWYEYDLKEPATAVNVMRGGSMRGSGMEPTGLHIKGPTVTRLAVFDRRDKRWTTQDLREPAKGEVMPLVSSTTVTYRVGRFLYIYSAVAKKWSVLELKRDATNPNEFEKADADGSWIIQDGEVFHYYDPKVGEWTQFDTKDEK